MVGVLNGNNVPSAKCFVTIKSDKGENEGESKSFGENLINSHNAAKSLELIVSNDLYQSHIKHILDSFHHLHSYRLKCKLGNFLNSKFLDKFVRKSGVNSIVISETLLDHQDVYAIVNGQLILSLTKDTYERAGLVGQKSKLTNYKYIVKYDLRDPKFYDSKPYSRLIWASENTLIEEIPFAFTTENKLEDTEGFANAIYTEISPNIQHFNQVITPYFSSLPIDSDSSSEVYYREAVEEYVQVCSEWSGLISLGSNQVLKSTSVDRYLSNYTVLDSDDDATDIVLITWKGGPITNTYILSLWNHLSQPLKTNNWLNLNIIGIEDIPIAWNSKEHCYLISGENNYSIFTLKDNTKISIKVVNGKDL